jgi:hypothetical protein
VFFWFIGTAIVSVGFVFRDPRFDYRLLIVGSVLPLLDGFIEPMTGVMPLHSVVVAVVLLAVVMLATAGRRELRRLLLGLPIGILLHLVFDGAWADAEVFWWPVLGVEPTDTQLPLRARGVLSVVLEVAGIAVCWWIVRTNHLQERGRRQRFAHDGRLTVGPVG